MSSYDVDKTDFAKLLPELRRELAEANSRAQEAIAQVESLRKVVEGLEELSGKPSSRPAPLFLDTAPIGRDSEGGPRGQEAVRQVLASDPNRSWQLREITSEILSRGWINPKAKVPDAAIRAATQRLAGAGLATRDQFGRYTITARGLQGPG